MKFEALFNPIKIGPIKIRNRIAHAPFGGLAWANARVYPNEELLAYYSARAKGGAGLIIQGATLISEFGVPDAAYHLRLYDVSHHAGIYTFAERMHAFGAKLFIQLITGWGAQAAGHYPGARTPIAPSAVRYEIPPENMPKGLDSIPRIGPMCREMTVEEIQQLVKAMGESAKRALLCGVDGIEIHTAHGYLGHEFLSPRFNKRKDMYGGSLENRMRFLVELFQSAKTAVGNDIAIGMRISSDEHMPGGLNHAEVKLICKKMEDLGMDYIHLSAGSYEAMKYLFPADEKIAAEGLDYGASLKSILKIPVIVPSIHNPILAENAVKEGKTDMISLGRQFIADPEWPNKVKEGRVDEIVRCKRDNWGCLHLGVFTRMAMRCTVNPNRGREHYMPEYYPPPIKKFFISGVSKQSDI